MGVADWSAVLTGAQESTSWSQSLLRMLSVWSCGLWAAVLGQSCRGALLSRDMGPQNCGEALVGVWLGVDERESLAALPWQTEGLAPSGLEA